MAKQTFTSGQVLTAQEMNDLQENDYNWTVSTKTASYVLAAGDEGTRIVMDSASATTITVDDAIFAAGDVVWIHNIGAGTVTVTAGTATVNTAGGLGLALGQYAGGQLYFTSASAALFFPNEAGGTLPYADASARTTAVPSPVEGQMSYLEDTNAVEVYDGSAWAAVGGGKILQVVTATYSTTESTTSSTYVDTSLTATITPSDTTSKILVLASVPVAAEKNASHSTGSGYHAIERGGSQLVEGRHRSYSNFLVSLSR